ncbi:hypothetical protein SDC9_175874 [bioreactor metagenome]|uniref:Uncharacterized protein n=1 Tax=bioreactor metagenome TaxID=1076179 RepID=A0A645GXQ8_9ZZZZ
MGISIELSEALFQLTVVECKPDRFSVRVLYPDQRLQTVYLAVDQGIHRVDDEHPDS